MENNKGFTCPDFYTRYAQGTKSEHIKNGQYQEYSDGTKKLVNFYSPPQSTFDSEEMAGSMQQILSMNIGEYVVVEFLIGTEMIVRKQGALYHVGTSYITLYDDVLNNFIVCDIFSIKFVYFYLPGERPPRNFNALSNTNNNSNNMNNNSNNMNNNSNNMNNRR